jgi:ABC-2 type transport system permease protein
VRNAALIAAREYRQHVRGTGFRVMTALGFVVILVLAFVPAIFDAIESSGQRTVAVVDLQNRLAPALRSALTGRLPNGEHSIEVAAVESEESARRGVRSGEYDGALIPEEGSSFVYRSERPGGEVEQLRRALAAISARQRLLEAGLSEEQLERAFRAPPVEVVATGEAATGEEFVRAYWLVYALTFLLYLTVIQYGSMVSTGVIREKSSRITEIMVSSVRPFEQMAGRICGVGLVGLTQYAFWILAGAITLAMDRFRGAGSGPDLAAVSPGTLFLFVVFFLLGFLLYATLLAGLGSLVSRMEDATQLQMPVYLLLIAGFLLTTASAANPDGALAVWSSYIPFFSPLVMFARTELGSPAPWEVALSILVLALSALAATWIAARIYRTGVLLYGKRPTFREIARQLRTG